MRPGHASGKLEPALKRPHLVPERPEPVPVGHKPAPERPEIAFEMPELDPWTPEPASDGPWAGGGGMDGRMHIFPLCTTRLCFPLGPKPKKKERKKE